LRLSPNDEATVLGPATAVRKPEKIERLRLPLTTTCSALGCKSAKLNQSSLLLVDSKAKLGKAPFQIRQHLPRILFSFEP
jgi:hypothetical protein